MAQAVAHYNILERIGAGGMGEVFRARDTRLGRTVAIKMLPDEVAADPDRRERFLREARAAAALSHPNIATLFEIGEEDGRLFLVFEFVPGETLRTVLASGAINTRRGLDFAIQLADAVAEAHGAGVIHRDLKPDNIMITPKDKAKILDFGLATWTAGGAARSEAAATQMATGPGTALGTVAYMSPEQALGGRVDARSDIFSLGLVILEMLAGRNPFLGPTPAATAINIVQSPTPTPSALRRGVPPELDQILTKALAKDLTARYQSAATMAAELRSVAAILDIRAGDTEPVALLPPARPRRAPWKAIAALLVVVAGGGAAWVWGRDPARALWRRHVAAGPDPVIAVMPLIEAEAGGGRPYFADGLTDDLITRLGQTPGLKVLGRSSTREFRGRSPTEVAQELGAAAVLTGTVDRQADQLKVTVELLDAADGIHLWGDQFLRPVTNVFAVQTEIADEVARALRLRLAPSAARARTASRLVNARAYDLYLQAREAAARRQTDDAIALYERAVEADATLAEAHAGLAEALYLNVINAGGADRPDRWLRIDGTARAAASIDPDLPQAQLALGLASRSLAEALGHLRRAVDADPSYPEALHQIADQIAAFDPARAVQFYRRQLELDPASDITYGDLVVSYLLLDRPREAEAESRRGAAAIPGAFFAPAATLTIRFDQRQFTEAERIASELLLQADQTRPEAAVAAAHLWRARALAELGRLDEALAVARAGAALPGWPTDGGGVLVALLIDTGATAEGQQLAERLIAAAEAPNASPVAARVAVAAAAALRDPVRTSRWLRRILGDELLFRVWSLQMTATPGQLPLRHRWYPWSRVADHPDVQAAEAEILRQNERLKAVAAQALSGLLREQE